MHNRPDNPTLERQFKFLNRYALPAFVNSLEFAQSQSVNLRPRSHPALGGEPEPLPESALWLQNSSKILAEVTCVAGG